MRRRMCQMEVRNRHFLCVLILFNSNQQHQNYFSRSSFFVTTAAIDTLFFHDDVLFHLLWEAPTRMPDVEHDSSDGTRNAVQANEESLVPQDWIVGPAAGQLCYSIATSNQNSDVCYPQRDDEEFELRRSPQSGGGWVEIVSMSICSKSVIGSENAKDNQCEDLCDEACNHHVSSDFQHRQISTC